MNNSDDQEKEFLSKGLNDGLTLISVVVATVLAIFQGYLLFYPSPREIDQRRIDRTEHLDERFRDLWYGETITRFRDAQRRIEDKELPPDSSAWASRELDRVVSVTNVIREISRCVRKNECTKSLLTPQFCEAVALYDTGFRALGVIAADYPDDTSQEIKFILAQCR